MRDQTGDKDGENHQRITKDREVLRQRVLHTASLTAVAEPFWLVQPRRKCQRGPNLTKILIDALMRS